ncbi:hypothetical protein [Demequina maris]|uniref:hypothetical protein n=1 Tax=Demequina maris TaxID=1638982 RepID=UPI0007813F4F|nr:hypothetical protein [Demequina maris]
MEESRSFTGSYIDACVWRIEAQFAAIDSLRLQAPIDGSLDAAIDEVEEEFLAAMAGQVEGMFASRARALEHAPGPLVEMRAIAWSLGANGGRFESPEGAGLNSQTTILKVDPGDPVRLTRRSFQRLADAFLTAVESTYRDRTSD